MRGEGPSGGAGALRVVVSQPAIPHYRVAFFAAASAALGGRLRVHVPDEGRSGGQVRAETAPVAQLGGIDHRIAGRFRPLLGGRLLWDTRWQALFEGAPDVVVLTGNARLLSNLAVLLHARRRGVGVVWWGHLRSHASGRLSTALRGRMMRLADSILLYTDRERDGLIGEGFPASRVFCANNGLDTRAIAAAMTRATPEAVDVERAALGLPAGAPLFLFIGRFTPKSGLPLLVEAARILAGRGIAASFVLVGDGALRAGVEAAARDAGLGPRFRFLGAIHDEDRLARLCAAATAFVYPGAVGLSVLHALYHGLPVVVHASRARHNPEADAFEEGRNGLAFAEGDPASLADALVEIAADPQRRARMRQHALRETPRRFSVETMVAGFVAACRAAAARRGRG